MRIATAACLVVSGLLVGGAGGALALADPDRGGSQSQDGRSNDSPRGVSGDGPGRPGDNNGQGNGNGNGQGNDHDSGDAGNPATGGGQPDNPGQGNGPGDNNGQGGNGNGQGNDHDSGDAGNPGNGGGQPDNPGQGNGPGDNNGQGQGSGQSGEPKPTETTPTTKPTETTPTTKPTEEPVSCPLRPCPGPGEPPVSGGDGGGGAIVLPPIGQPPKLPLEMQLPPELLPPTEAVPEPAVTEAAPGVGVAAAEFPLAPITLPVIVVPPVGIAGGGAPPAAPPGLTPPAAPRAVTAEPPAGREPMPPANVGSNIAVPLSSYRIGYAEYLRTAGLSQIAALAVPGVGGILVFTGAGGLLGYRQAKAGHMVRASTARFIN